MKSSFWADHERRLEDPEYARAFAVESVRVTTIDSIMSLIAELLEDSGMTKAALAQAIGANPAAVRRLLSADGVNPTLGTLAELAGALGMKVTLQPMTAAERKMITKPMTVHARKPARGPRAKVAASA
jgi:DNA-binding phage protein